MSWEESVHNVARKESLRREKAKNEATLKHERFISKWRLMDSYIDDIEPVFRKYAKKFSGPNMSANVYRFGYSGKGLRFCISTPEKNVDGEIEIESNCCDPVSIKVLCKRFNKVCKKATLDGAISEHSVEAWIKYITREKSLWERLTG